jgi:hypothetical protein
MPLFDDPEEAAAAVHTAADAEEVEEVLMHHPQSTVTPYRSVGFPSAAGAEFVLETVYAEM